MRKLAIIATHPIQYQAPLWRALATTPDLDVHVYYGSDFSIRGYHDAQFGVSFKWDLPLTEGYAHTFLSTDPAIQNLGGMFDLRATGLSARLREFQPDAALISAYTPRFFWEALLHLRRQGIPVLLRSEATDVALSRSLPKKLARQALLRSFYSQCARFLAIGHHARQHYLAHHIPAARIFSSPYCVDDALFSRQAAQFAPQRAATRQALGFAAHHTVFLYSAKLIAKKDPLTLARALALVPALQREKLALLVVGDGELRSEMETTCHAALGQRARFLGFINQSQIGQYYAAADCLVLPSVYGETWGLVVNEGFNFGLPAIVSDRVGCHPDLIEAGITGFVFPAGDETALAECLQQTADWLPANRTPIATACRNRIADYSVERAASGIHQALYSLP